MINVTKTFLPPFEEYTAILKRAWDKSWITNHGVLAQELEYKLQKYLGVDHLLFTGNGTIVLQMALKAFGITKEVITTPFSYVATTNAVIWENARPVFVDIDPKTFCIDPQKIKQAITPDTEAILATHVYGLPCDVEAIEEIAKEYNLKVIYDAAHAFGSEYMGKPLLAYGDIATCSFHATKLFHTVEGGCIVCHNPEIHRKLFLMRSFGHIGDEYFSVGINGKNSEFHAAMGLANLPYLEEIIEKRKALHYLYVERLADCHLEFLSFDEKKVKYNYAYFPVVFRTEIDLLNAKVLLEQNGINARRYFYPSLNTLSFLPAHQPCPVSEDIAKRVLCLPLFASLEHEQLEQISLLINQCSSK
jgi:dTDP-4-amino-4,6-dideoxygalactose transaminase